MIYVLPPIPREPLCLRLSMGIKIKLYQGLPEFLADALPDKWGASLFDQWLTDNNIKVTESLPLLKLSYIGKRAMGALEFEPEFNDDDIQETVDMSSLATLASKIYNDRDAAVISPEDSLTMKSWYILGPLPEVCARRQ